MIYCLQHDMCQGMKGVLPDLELPPTLIHPLPFPPWFTAFITKTSVPKIILNGIIVIKT